MGHKIGVHRHRPCYVGGPDAAEDGPHGGQSLLAGYLRLPVVDQRVHKLVDDAGVVGRCLEGEAGAVAPRSLMMMGADGSL